MARGPATARSRCAPSCEQEQRRPPGPGLRDIHGMRQALRSAYTLSVRALASWARVSMASGKPSRSLRAAIAAEYPDLMSEPVTSACSRSAIALARGIPWSALSITLPSASHAFLASRYPARLTMGVAAEAVILCRRPASGFGLGAGEALHAAPSTAQTPKTAAIRRAPVQGLPGSAMAGRMFMPRGRGRAKDGCDTFRGARAVRDKERRSATQIRQRGAGGGGAE
jgi:hypothetical protein